MYYTKGESDGTKYSDDYEVRIVEGDLFKNGYMIVNCSATLSLYEILQNGVSFVTNKDFKTVTNSKKGKMEYYEFYEHVQDSRTGKTYFVNNLYTFLGELEKDMKQVLNSWFSEKRPFLTLHPSLLRNVGNVSNPQFPHWDYKPYD